MNPTTVGFRYQSLSVVKSSNNSLVIQNNNSYYYINTWYNICCVSSGYDEREQSGSDDRDLKDEINTLISYLSLSIKYIQPDVNIVNISRFVAYFYLPTTINNSILQLTRENVNITILHGCLSNNCNEYTFVFKYDNDYKLIESPVEVTNYNEEEPPVTDPPKEPSNPLGGFQSFPKICARRNDESKDSFGAPFGRFSNFQPLFNVSKEPSKTFQLNFNNTVPKLIESSLGKTNKFYCGYTFDSI